MKRKTPFLLFLCLILGSSSITAQSTIKFVNFSAGPIYGSTNLKSITSAVLSSPRTPADLNESIDGQQIGGSGQWTLTIPIYKKLSLETGCYISQFKYQHHVLELRTAADAFTGNSTDIDSKIQIRKIGIPLLASYQLNSIEKRFGVHAILGCIPQRVFSNIKRSVSGSISDPSFLESNYDFNKFNISAYSGVKAAFAIAERHFITLLPFFEYNLIADTYDGHFLEGHLFTTGIQIGYGIELQ